jgi:dihydroneopterin aldolase
VAAAQRRIDLLAIEQNAWVLAGRDTRCVVVGSRTELDWAMKHDVITVWAPSKILLDTVKGPATPLSDGAALALWFAREMEARSLIALGAEAPAGGDLPVRALPADAVRLRDA